MNRASVRSGLLRLLRDRRRLHEGSRPAFVARALPAIPQLDVGRESRLYRGELESETVVADVLPVQALDHALDPLARLPWRTRQPAREVHVVLALEAPQLGLEDLQLALDIRGLVRHDPIIVS